ncbi:MarR family winged helix-turn-helix transcriptional regulator [Promicromonospora citrea]|uniref:Transcriptional regulator n=1 Tax=Promicromonospora citrea TaxID=43677 RepID=A0A8H9GLF0_9MICO|nr:MarR family winged helix-turn-helix transcriptional regulator [Promicromonospora citrea]NNH54883.1 winged helix-turn-helix transcriptional regulator [Promicromonospora citrea]GGM37055.1 transcriptional regulator [Promicromonospora citrea]HEV6954023.1 MarR family winged helix-turn-helix transcriptional regulator [Promicromonospora sp.]
MDDYPLDGTAALPPADIAAAWERELPGVPTSSIGVLTPLWRAAKTLAEERRRTLARLGLDAATLDLLSTLRRSGPPYTLTTRQLAAQTLVTAGAISQRVARAERDGLVVRQASTASRRAVAVVLTDAGHARVGTAVRALLEHEEALVAALDPVEREALGALLARLGTAAG